MNKNLLLLISACIFLIKYAHPQTTAADNTPSETTALPPPPTGPNVVGLFEGRPPCLEIAKQLKILMTTDCIKLKWGLTLYQDPNTFQPTTYILDGSLYRNKPREGKWTIIKGTKSNPNAMIYQLDPDKPEESFYFLKGDENVLFILDENKELRVGNQDFSYTLNRVRPVQKK